MLEWEARKIFKIAYNDPIDSKYVEKRYRKLAKKLHPDKSTQENATDLFVRLGFAKGILMKVAEDKSIKRVFDSTGTFDASAELEQRAQKRRCL